MWASSDAKAHLMAFAFLVLFTGKGVERSAAQVLAESGIVIRVEYQVARKCGGAFRGAHASQSEGDGSSLVSEREQVWWVGPQEGYDHVSRDALFVRAGQAEYTGKAPDKAGVGQGALNRRREAGLPMA